MKPNFNLLLYVLIDVPCVPFQSLLTILGTDGTQVEVGASQPEASQPARDFPRNKKKRLIFRKSQFCIVIYSILAFSDLQKLENLHVLIIFGENN